MRRRCNLGCTGLVENLELSNLFGLTILNWLYVEIDVGSNMPPSRIFPIKKPKEKCVPRSIASIFGYINPTKLFMNYYLYQFQFISECRWRIGLKDFSRCISAKWTSKISSREDQFHMAKFTITNRGLPTPMSEKSKLQNQWLLNHVVGMGFRVRATRSTDQRMLVSW